MKRYSDPISGIDYRWDDAKNKWVKSTGRDPWNDQFKPMWNNAVQQTIDRYQKAPPNINEYFNSILQERWDSAVTEDDKASVRDLLAAFNVKEEKDIIQSETGAAPTSVIPESFSEYRGRTAGEMVQDEVTTPPSEKEVNKVESGVLKKEEPEEVEQPPMMSIADLKQWELDTRNTTPAGKAFGESGAEQRMGIRRRYLESRGTIFDDNVRD